MAAKKERGRPKRRAARAARKSLVLGRDKGELSEVRNRLHDPPPHHCPVLVTVIEHGTSLHGDSDSCTRAPSSSKERPEASGQGKTVFQTPSCLPSNSLPGTVDLTPHDVRFTLDSGLYIRDQQLGPIAGPQSPIHSVRSHFRMGHPTSFLSVKTAARCHVTNPCNLHSP